MTTEKEKWTARTEEDKREEIVFNMIIDFFDDEKLENEELDNLVSDLKNLDDLENIKKIKACAGYNIFIEKHTREIEINLKEWNQRIDSILNKS